MPNRIQQLLEYDEGNKNFVQIFFLTIGGVYSVYYDLAVMSLVLRLHKTSTTVFYEVPPICLIVKYLIAVIPIWY